MNNIKKRIINFIWPSLKGLNSIKSGVLNLNLETVAAREGIAAANAEVAAVRMEMLASREELAGIRREMVEAFRVFGHALIKSKPMANESIGDHSRLRISYDVLRVMRDLASKTEPQSEILFLTYCAAHLSESKAQLFQDLFVLHELGERREGFFLEFGAIHGAHFSNTFLLEEKYRWNGIRSEPVRCLPDQLGQNQSGAIDSMLEFNEVIELPLTTVNSFPNVDNLKYRCLKAGQACAVETITLNDLLAQDKAPKDIDYLSINAKGCEFDVLRGFGFGKYNVKIISVEHNYAPARQKIFELLVSHGYVRKFECFSDFEDWYVRAKISA